MPQEPVFEEAVVAKRKKQKAYPDLIWTPNRASAQFKALGNQGQGMDGG